MDRLGEIYINSSIAPKNIHLVTLIFFLFSAFLTEPLNAESRLINISSRANVGNGSGVLIGGLIIDGPEEKTVLVTAVGPSMANAGVTGTLQNPQLELYSGSVLIDSNDDWSNHPRAAEIPLTYQPDSIYESAILITLEPGAYTAIVKGLNDTSGVGLVAVYDMTANSASILRNISSRAQVGGSGEMLIGGLIIEGNTAKKVLIKAIGPSLESTGLTGLLQDPVLEIYSGAEIIETNDDWKNHPQSGEIPQAYQPKHIRESAIVATLNPGAYTAMVKGLGGSTGIGLVEVYDLETVQTRNTAPVASPVSFSVDMTTPDIIKQLVASDADGDTLTYELMAPRQGTGYTDAHIDSSTGKLFLTITDVGDITLSYRVTDGQLFSEPADIRITVLQGDFDDSGLGREEVDALTYAGFGLSAFSGELLGTADGQAIMPRSIDLSGNFPAPGSQGRQNSCVGWATAYALKSYQERIEMGWSLSADNHLFSPSWVYNQINDGQDEGSYIPDALTLLVQRGAASMQSMPYDSSDYRSQPDSSARQEAANFYAQSWSRVAGATQIKSALVNRKPVVAGINIYDEFYRLSGGDAVYNTATGNSRGGHAVTIVGFDDDRFGGAYRVINSWGGDWGDQGYFWMPYSTASSGILREAYVLEDRQNGLNIDPGDDINPVPNANLPNLHVESWNASYDARPRGEGELKYRIVNSGSATAPAGVSVNLMLSSNAVISASDIYVVYENIPFDMQSGGGAHRDDDNPISFRFPDQLAPGEYYMALWLDDQRELLESDEGDNVSLGSSRVLIENHLPDLAINSWYASWDGNGNGTLQYEVENLGNATAERSDWDINLMLSINETISSNDRFVFYEDATFSLSPGGKVYRRENNAASFSLHWDAFGNAIPSGQYFMALWIDDQDQVAESNELNNTSLGQSTVRLGLSSAKSVTESDDPWGQQIAESSGRMYNGKALPPPELVVRKVNIEVGMDGKKRLEFIGESKQSYLQSSEVADDAPSFRKTNQAADPKVFPVVSSRAIP
jgi:hypothetical protein